MEQNEWVKSSRSSDSANCVMLFDTNGDILIGDDKRADWQNPENTLRLSREVFAAFLGDVIAGAYDLC